MHGWKTWIAAISSIIWGVGGYIGTTHGVDVAAGFVVGGLGMLGLGHKLDKVVGKK